jgi:hypothetical protein
VGEAELAFPTLDFESEKLEATRNVHNPGLRLIRRGVRESSPLGPRRAPPRPESDRSLPSHPPIA